MSRVNRVARFSGAIAFALFVAPRAGHPQVAYDSPKGRVEVLGLHRWTLKMLQDSVRHYVPGQELSDHACMVTLRDSLRFPDAYVEYYFTQVDSGPMHVLLSIKVVEPQDSNLVHWDTHPRKQFSSLLPEYASLVLAASDTSGTIYPGRILQGLETYHADSVYRRAVFAGAPAGAIADARRVWEFLNAHHAESDRQRAMKILKTNGFYANRLVASAVLSNFASNDSTWWTLVRTLREPQDPVRSVARSAIEHMAPRAIDWTPAETDLRLILGGTNLGAMATVLTMLDRTSVSPDLASPLLRGNSDWLLATLASEHPISHPAAHRLLVRLNHGVDLGQIRANWVRWAAGL